jgi:hypothetical protein
VSSANKFPSGLAGLLHVAINDEMHIDNKIPINPKNGFLIPVPFI